MKITMRHRLSLVLSAAPLAGILAIAGTGVLLTHRNSIPAATESLLNQFSLVVAFGGPQVISDSLLESLVIE